MKKLLLMCALLILAMSQIYGCALITDAVSGGEEIQSLGNNKFRVTYHGMFADHDWMVASQKLCKGEFEIISQSQVKRFESIPSWTGIIKCKKEINLNQTAQFKPSVDTEDTVRAVLDKGGEPIDTWVQTDVTPNQKVILYKRANLVHAIVFVKDKDTDAFIYQDMLVRNLKDLDTFRDQTKKNKGLYAEILYHRVMGKAFLKRETRDGLYVTFALIDTLAASKDIMETLELIKPRTEKADYLLAYYYALVMDDPARAIASAESLSLQDPNPGNIFWRTYIRGIAYSSAGDFKRAAEMQESCIAVAPSAKQTPLLPELYGMLDGYRKSVKASDMKQFVVEARLIPKSR